MRRPAHPNNARTSQRSFARWVFAVVVALAIVGFITNVQSGWVSATTFGANPFSGTVAATPAVGNCGDGSQQFGFLDSNGAILESVNLDNPGDSVDIQICADGLTLGGPDTAQLVIEHDDSVIELTNAACTGLLDGGLVSPSTKRTSDDQASAFICTKPGGVSGSGGALLSLTVRRTGAGVETLSFRSSGALSTGLYESGVALSVSGFDSMVVQQDNASPIPTSTPAAAPVAAPAPFFPPPPAATSTPAPSGDSGPGLRFEPPTAPTSFEAVAGILFLTLTWGVPDDTSNRPVDDYTIQNLRTGEIVRVAGDVYTYTFFGLEAGVEYFFIIKAATGLGIGPNVGIGPVMPLDNPVPTATATVAPVPVVPAVPETEVPAVVTPISTAEIIDSSTGDEAGTGSGEIVLTAVDSDALEAALEEILGSDVTVDEAVATLLTTGDGISIEIPVDGLTGDSSPIGDIDVQIGQLGLKVEDGVGNASLRISEDIAIVGAASASLGSGGLDVQMSDPVLLYSPETHDDGSFGDASGGSGILIEDVAVSFAVGLDNLPDAVVLTTTYSASPAALESSTGTVFALSGGSELAYFVSIEKSGVTQDDLGDNVVAMNVPLSWLDAMVAAGREIAITKISDSGEVFTEAAQCERLPDIAVCTVTFTGEAGGFSIFAIYGFVNENPQPAPMPLTAELPTPTTIQATTPAPAGTSVPPTPTPSPTPTPTPQVAPAPTAESESSDLIAGTGGRGDTGTGGPGLLVIVAVVAVVAVAGGVVVSAYYRRPSISTAGLIVIITAVGGVVLLAGNTSVAEAGGVADVADPNIRHLDASHIPDFDKNDSRFRKVGSSIRALKEAQTAGVLDEMSAFAEFADLPEFEATDPSIEVTIWFESAEDVNLNLISYWGTVLNHIEDVVEVRVPIRIAHQLSYMPGVVRVDQIVPPQTNVTSEGTTVHKSPAWNNVGLDGAGIKVGVIDGGFESWSSISPSELPTPVGVRCYTSVGVFTSALSDCENGITHGTAVAEAVDDIAPGVVFYIANPKSPLDLVNTEAWMASEGVTIINHSVGWGWDGPGDGTSPLSDSPLNTVDRAVVDGILWVNAAGNGAKDHWYGTYNDTNFDGFLNLSGSLEYQTILAGAIGGNIELRWEDSWGGAMSDLRLWVTDSSNTPFYVSDNTQAGGAGDVPYEWISDWLVAGDRIWIEHVSGPAPDWIQVRVRGNLGLSDPTAARSIAVPAESANPGMLAVGAANYATKFSIESFSSQGPTIDGRIKPDIVGADGANSASDGHWIGTSQASPHVAGLAALALQRFPSKTPAELATYLKEGAADRGSEGVDNVWGYGFAELTAPTAPTAVADSYSVNEDTLLAVAVPGVMSNDSDDADSFTPQIVATPSHASSFSLESDGSFTYTPATNYSGSDSFTYKDVDPWQTSSTVSVGLTINAIADLSGTSTVQGVSDPNAVGISVSGTGSSTGVTAINADSGGAFSKQLSADTFTF
jgi:hypothetical protein